MSDLRPVSFKKGRNFEPRLSEPYVPGRRSERYWTDPEDAILREHFEKESGPQRCQDLLPKRGPQSIYQRARKLGLEAKSQVDAHGRKARIAVPDDIDDQIRAAWPEMDGRRKGEVNALADRLGVPRWWLSKRLVALELTTPHKKEPPWSDAERALMRDAPLHDLHAAAKFFRQHGYARSPVAIGVMAKRMDLSRRDAREEMSATAVAKLLGVDQKWVAAFCISGELKATKRNDRRLVQQGGHAWDIKPIDLKDFVIRFIERIDIRKVEKVAFVDLLVKGHGKRRSSWLPAEDEIIREGYQNKIKLPLIIDQLAAAGYERPTLSAISLRAAQLGVRSAERKDEWTDPEDEIVRTGYVDGTPIRDIKAKLSEAGFEREFGAIQMRAIKLGITTDRVKYWSKEETDIALRVLRAHGTHEEARAALKEAGYTRGPTAMFKFAQKHHVLRPKDAWTEAADAKLRELYVPGCDTKAVAAALNRTIGSLRSRASQLGLRVREKWTDAERQILIDGSAANRSLKACADEIDRPYQNVAAEARRLNLDFQKTKGIEE